MDNISHILSNGITGKKSPNRNPSFKSIGDKSLIDNRSTKRVWVSNGLYSNQIKQIILGDFIPFYFGIRMPMLYVIQKGGNFVEESEKPEDIVYVVCSLNAIIQRNLSLYFSDGHATDRITLFYDSSKINDLPKIIDWSAIKARYWSGQENLNLKRKKQAEFLIREDIPSEAIVGFGCYNEKAKYQLIKFGVKRSFH